MEDDEAHALVDAPGDALDDGVVDAAVGLVAPPEQDVGLVEPRLGQAVLGLVLGGGRDRDALVGVEAGGDRAVDAVGVDRADDGVLALVDVLVPDDGSDHHAALFSGRQSQRRSGPRVPGRGESVQGGVRRTGVARVRLRLSV